MSMNALVYLGLGEKALEVRPQPKIAATTDAIVKISQASICDTDLHILKGAVPTCSPWRALGHEGVCIVHEVG
jgi:alcohol dehydrogenase